MAVLGVVVGLFLSFSLAMAWVGGDREKAALEDAIKKGQWTQASLSAQAYAQGERLDELQDRLEDSLIERNKLERGATAAETGNAVYINGPSPSNPFLDPEPSVLDDVESTDQLTAAETSLKRETSARSAAEKRLFYAQRAVSYLETELNGSVDARRDWRDIKEGESCRWDPERR